MNARKPNEALKLTSRGIKLIKDVARGEILTFKLFITTYAASITILIITILITILNFSPNLA